MSKGVVCALALCVAMFMPRRGVADDEFAIKVVKLTNGDNHDTPPGLVVPVGTPLTFTYLVTTPGAQPLQIYVVDDHGTPDVSDDFAPLFVGGDTNGNGLLELGETWTYSASAVATLGPHPSSALASTTSGVLFDHDAEYYYGRGGIDLVKLTNGTNNDAPPGLPLPVGSSVTFTYLVTPTTGSLTGMAVILRDDNGTPGNSADDFAPQFVGGDTNGNQNLDAGETWTFTATTTVTSGQYTNVATVEAIPFDGPVSAADVDAEFLLGSQPVAVPTLNGVGIGLLAVVLAGLGLLGVRRSG